MAPGSTGTKDESAKHVLDEIGEKVYKEIVGKKADGTAEKYIEELKGYLKKAASTSLEIVDTIETCALVNKYISKVGDRDDPCKELSGIYVERFSDKIGGQCTNEKIEGNTYIKGKDVGACAPYRRLHLCSHNLETINNTTSTTSDTLLAEVCYAAKEEGESLKKYHAQYQEKYGDTGSTICTVLARSFADIGDIVRGKDLFLGNDEEKKKRKQLDENLKTIFKNIYKKLLEENQTRGKNGAEALKARYDGDTPDFFQLREDWWNANRATVWEALTCEVGSGTYFHATCNSADGNSKSQANNKCTCNNGDVPTYFDYVPQYLRWFEEWAEDFCRLRKRKLKDAIRKCRGEEHGEHKYCDLNRHNCVETIRGDHVFVEDNDCDDCSVACKPFVKWIDNQKLELDKQKRKYKSEIKGGGSGRSSRRKKRGARASDDNGYESKFYEQLKKKKRGYGTVDKFLEKLSNEGICKDPPTVGHETADAADFTKDKTKQTFSHTTYCQACPWCGAQKGEGGKLEAKGDATCGKGKDYKKYENTQIPILTGDKTKGDMVQKYKKFCNGNGGNGATGTVNGGAPGEKGASGKNGDNITETWECYYKKKEKDDVNGDINFCVQQKQENDGKKEYSMHYNAFFLGLGISYVTRFFRVEKTTW